MMVGGGSQLAARHPRRARLRWIRVGWTMMFFGLLGLVLPAVGFPGPGAPSTGQVASTAHEGPLKITGPTPLAQFGLVKSAEPTPSTAKGQPTGASSP